jgi:hypothetical protein
VNEDKTSVQILKSAQRKMKRAGWVSHYDSLRNRLDGIDRSPFYLRVRTTPKHRYLVVSNELFRVDVKRPTCFEEVMTFLTKKISERREAVRKAEEQNARIVKVRVWAVSICDHGDLSATTLLRFLTKPMAETVARTLQQALPYSESRRDACARVEPGHTYLDIDVIDSLKKQGIDVSVVPKSA